MPHPPEKGAAVGEALAAAIEILRVQIAVLGCFDLGLERPLEHLYLAQAPRALLDIRLQKLDGLPRFKPLLAQPIQLGDCALGHALVEPLLELSKKRSVASQQAAVHHRRARLQIFAYRPDHVVQRAAAVTHLKPQVPQRIEYASDNLGNLVLTLGEQKE